MKKCLIFVIALFLILAVGCDSSIRYGGKDTMGKTAADVVNEFYDIFKNEGYTEAASSLGDISENTVIPNISLVKLNHCEVVERSKIDISYLNDIPDDIYAVCCVQTSDSIFCNENTAEGIKGETVSRNYAYYLIMETKDSSWKIFDYGYPPIYISK